MMTDEGRGYEGGTKGGIWVAEAGVMGSSEGEKKEKEFFKLEE